ncbi:hypothetical protein [Idiomarina fontislapidosi]|uniref:Uncharacterized protein n=1 Tax=Idiomarina fontislapidosi TaxID=263723 RepID=A0A432YAM4_9GAMM|nr:hypothetical protein [Idiomarina fontislapidosi]RUO58028.1 hypothetical protein CWE25_00050 [Idiomarina fontislapidosi]
MSRKMRDLPHRHNVRILRTGKSNVAPKARITKPYRAHLAHGQIQRRAKGATYHHANYNNNDERNAL